MPLGTTATALGTGADVPVEAFRTGTPATDRNGIALPGVMIRSPSRLLGDVLGALDIAGRDATAQFRHFLPALTRSIPTLTLCPGHLCHP
jgi:hypothetical protein